MSRMIRSCVLFLPLCLWLATGCADNEGMEGANQQPIDAADRIAQLEQELDQAARNRMADQERILTLEAERDRLQDQMGQGGTGSAWMSVPGGAMTSIEGTVLFDSGQAKLKPGADTILAEIAQVIQDRFAGHEIYVFGHTDNEPIKDSGWSDNYELSCQRALTVLRSLRSRDAGLSIMAGGWGEGQPLSDNATAQGKQVNRRVEIYAIKPTRQITGSANAVRP